MFAGFLEQQIRVASPDSATRCSRLQMADSKTRAAGQNLATRWPEYNFFLSLSKCVSPIIWMIFQCLYARILIREACVRRTFWSIIYKMSVQTTSDHPNDLMSSSQLKLCRQIGMPKKAGVYTGPTNIQSSFEADNSNGHQIAVTNVWVATK